MFTIFEELPSIRKYGSNPSSGVRDWINNDSNGALRIAAWKDGGVNDICPAGFSVPNKGELELEALVQITITSLICRRGANLTGA
jgi:hypothetical protein